MNKSLKQSNKCNLVSADVCIDKILTQRTCADIVVEIIKLLSHQKLQIPYKYEVLKYLVEKKKESDKSKPDSSWQSQKHFHTVSTALNVLDNIFKNLTSELESADPPKEVCIILGATPTSPKEVFRVVLPNNLHIHYHRNHMQTARNVVLETLRKITTSSVLCKTVFHPIQPTNVFVLLNRRRITDEAMCSQRRAFSEFFHPVHNLKISPKITQTVINLRYTSPPDTNCCDQMIIFEDFALKCSMNEGDNFVTSSDVNYDSVTSCDASNKIVISSDVSNDISSSSSNASDLIKDKGVISNADETLNSDQVVSDAVKSTTDEAVTANSIISMNLKHIDDISFASEKKCSISNNVNLSSSDLCNDDGKLRDEDCNLHNDDGNIHNDKGDLHDDVGNLRNDDNNLRNDKCNNATIYNGGVSLLPNGGILHSDDCKVHNDDCKVHNDDCKVHNDDCKLHSDDCKLHNDEGSSRNDDSGIHNDNMENVNAMTDCKHLVSEEKLWFQAPLVLKGFKDCFINGKSISNSWGS